MRAVNGKRLEQLQELVDNTVKPSSSPAAEGLLTFPLNPKQEIEMDITLKDTQQIRVGYIEIVTFASQKPLRQRAAPYFAKAERFYGKAEDALVEVKDDLAKRRFELASKYYARGFKNLYSEVLLEQDYYVLRRVIKHYGTSLELSNKEQQAVDEFRRIGRFLMNRNHWLTAQVALDEAVRLIEDDKLPTSGKEQQYLNLAELMSRGELIKEPKSQMIEFAKQEGMLDGIGYIRNGKRTNP